MTLADSARTAIVTGGSVGIGKEIARQLVADGVHVLLVGRRQALLDEAIADLTHVSAPEATVTGVCADVAHDAGLDRIVDTAVGLWGHVDTLINNAGIFDDATLLTLPRRSWEDVLAVNLTAPFLLTQKVGALMAARGQGSIVNMASVDGHRVDGTYVAYNVSKAAVLQLTRQTAVELGPFGVRCNSVSPGWTRTPMVEAALTESQLEHMSANWSRSPSQRMVTSEEVAATVVFLASSRSSGVNGADLVVDGGVTSNLWIVETVPTEAAEVQP